MIQIQKVSWFAGLCMFTFLANLQILSAGVNDGLVGWWKLDEGSGTSSSDSSGYDRSLALQNGVAWTDGVYGGAVDLDGSDDQISLSNLEVDGNFSVSLWAKPLSSTHIGGYESSSENNSISYLNRTIVKPVHGQGTDFGVGISVGTNGISSLIHASSIYCQPLIYSASLSSWTHIVLVLDNRQPKLYVNGNLARTGLALSRPVKLQISSGSPIGKGYDNDDRYHGGVDDFRIYDRVLSVDEINQLYDFPVGLHTVGSISVVENSQIGTIVGEFNATDPNGDGLSFTLYPSLPSQFSPVLWLDANDSSSVINSGGSVSEWRDKSGNNYHFTQNVDNSKRPLYSATSLNGMPTVTFDGSNDYLSRSSRLGFSANPDISVFAVTSFLFLANNDERIFQIGTNSHGLAVAGGTGRWSWRFNGGHEAYSSVSLNTSALQAWVRQAGTNYQASRFFFNGTEQVRTAGSSDSSVPTNTHATAIIGKSAAAGNFANVKISELIVLNDSSETSRKAIETYLARKWGLNYPHATSNGIFELESNGTLKSLVSLDRETSASYPIVVRATDTNGNFIDQNFSVSVLDDGQEDTDGDGFLDSIEISSGSNENNATSVPSDLPGFLGEATLWIDATNVDLKQNTTFSNGGSISQWKDQSGNGKHLTVINTANSPVLNTALVNSKDVISFTGDSLKTSEAVSVRSILAVHKTLNSHYLWDFRDGVANSWIYSGSAGSYWNQHVSNGVLQSSVNGGLVMNNQLQVAYFTGSSNGSGTFYLHSRYSNNEMGTGDLCELLIFNRLLNQQEIDSGEAYLAKKWGLDTTVDSDSDGFVDSMEYDAGTNPESNSSIPGLDYGMIAWYPFDGNASDMSGNGRHGTPYNGAGWTSGKLGQALSLDGINDYVDVGDFEIGGGVTFSVWVKYDSFKHWSRVFDFGNGENNNNILLAHYGTTSSGRFSHRVNSPTYELSGANLSINSWLHRVGVIEGNGNMRLYLNGSLVASNTNTSVLPTLTRTQQFVGRSNWSADGYLDGLIDDFRIYDRALSSDQISELYQMPGSDADGDGFTYANEIEAGTDPNSSSSKPELSNGLLLWYPLDGNTSDMSGNARHATLSNANGSTAGFVDGRILKALDFDGVDDFLSVPHDSGLDVRRNMSLSLWLKLDTIPTTGYSAICYKGGGNGGSTRTYSLWLENGSRFIHATSADSTDQQSANSANSAFTNNSWMHLVMLLDRNNGTIRAFKDKVMVANGSIRMTDTVSSSNPLLFGSSQESNSAFSDINGQMDDIRLYDRILYSFEIDNLHDTVVTDTDSDGLSDAEESLLDTNRTSSDTDGDGLTDFEEVMGYHTYEQINSFLTWSAAKADAESRGGYLATITSLEEKNKVETIRSSNSWLGGSDTQTEGTWQWVTGEPWSYTFWASSEPNGGTGESYLVTWTSSGNWNDYHTGTNGSYILEKEYFSNPNSQDTDGDGFPDPLEIDLGTDPNSVTTFTFNNAGATGKNGPNATQVNQAYLGTSLQGQVSMVSQGIQRWTVPVSGSYKIEALGASGGRFNSNAGKGSKMTGDFELNASDVLNILVGQEGLVAGNRGGGGGGTFVWLEGSSSPLLVAGGGGGNGQADVNSMDASLTTSGTADGGNHYNGGTGGNGGAAGFGNSGGGGGWLSAGGGAGGAKIYQGTGIGGTASGGEGGFGGGGAGESDSSGGGGGYSGGSGGWYGAGGGGSYNSGTNQLSSVRTSYGNGSLTITLITQGSTNQPPVSLGSSNSLAINENQVVGSTVGQFSANDPDGDAITFQLVNGAGDSGNSLFSLETNGTLKTAVVFDYENNASTYSIRARASDIHGGSVEGNFTITLLDLDDTAPIISLSGDSQITHEAGTTYLDANASWSDAVDGSGVIVASGEVNASDPGTYVLSYYYTDAAGNVAQTVTRTVHVVDTTAPVISLHGDATTTHEAGTAYLDANSSWSDAVDGSGVIVASGEVNASGPGTYILSYNYTDSAGNVAQTVTRTVHVVDSIAPIVSLYGDATTTHEAGTAYLDANASWSDAVDGTGVIVASGEFNASDPGTYILSYNYTDSAGNAAQTVTRTVHVVDSIAPIVSLYGDATTTHEAGTAYLDVNASWSDAVDGSGVIVASGEVNASDPGTYVLSYHYIDAAGNAAQKVTRTVHVVDTIAPIISQHGDANITHEAGFAYLDANASWSDAVDGTGVIVASGEVNASVPGFYLLSYNYTDAAGNVAQTVTRTVHVVDTIAPIISLHGDANITHEAGTAYHDANASWSDAVDGAGVIVASGEVNASDPGFYLLSYNYTDAAGNVAQTFTRTVHVVDTIAPVISLHGDANITHEAGFAYLDANASWSDAVDGTGVIVASGEVNASDPGFYLLSYNYTDAAGNVAQTVTRTVHVVDTIAPIISLHGDANITHEAGFAYLDANASWSDAVDGVGVIVASGEVNASDPGTYVLSYYYIDLAGNTAQTVTRTVHVMDTIAPVISLHGDSNITHEAGFAYLDANASWSDAVDGTGVIVASGEVNASDPGFYLLSYNYTDAAGNVAQTVTRTVNVVDTIAPIISLHGDANITHEAGFAYLDANASWSDAVDGAGVIVASGEVNASAPATYVLSYHYTDASGNAALTATRTVHVVDTIAPIISLHGDANITHEAGSAYVDANASWSDLVDGAGVILASGEVNASVPGIYMLFYNYTDASGNEAETRVRAVEVLNFAPDGLSVLGDLNLTVFENEANGTVVATFAGTDLNADHMLSYMLIDTVEQNATDSLLLPFFQLDENGTLLTLRSLDYEVDPQEISLLVRVTDQHGAYYEQTFLVSVLNVVEDFDGDGDEDYFDPDDDNDGFDDTLEHTLGFNPFDRWDYPQAPIVRTLEVSEQNGTLIFGAKILSSGGLASLDVGVSILDESGELIMELIQTWNTGSETDVSFYYEFALEPGLKIQYQAFAKNYIGTTKGQQLEYWIGGDPALGKWWESDSEVAGGWRESSWLGTYLPNLENDWVYHLLLGWMYVQHDEQGGVWLWVPDEKWLWTKEAVWPFLWSDSSDGWLYLIDSKGSHYFYDYSTESLRP